MIVSTIVIALGIFAAGCLAGAKWKDRQWVKDERDLRDRGND